MDVKIRDMICSVGRSGYFNKDLAAVKAGVEPDGFSYKGKPVTPGFREVVQPGETISVMLVLEDGQVAFGDCADVIFTGAAGRDPIFLAEQHLGFLETEIRDRLRGRDVDEFRPLAGEIEALPRDGKRLHTALRYGISQALLHATSLAHRETIAEVVAREYGCRISETPIPILTMCPTDQFFQVEKMILKGAELLPHASFSHMERDLGPGGEKVLDYAQRVARRVGELGAPGYKPTIHIDLYGTVGEYFSMDGGKIAGFLGEVKKRVGELDLFIETPVIAENQEKQIAAYLSIRDALREQGHKVSLIADEWCNTLEDIQRFADAGAAEIIQIKTPDLGGIQNTIEAVLYCQSKKVGAYVGGTGNETDQSSRISAQIALACRADFLLCKPGQGVDEGLLIQTNEMKRALALIRASREGKR